uniref:uncharacterized protein LOC100178769 isoform X2 n=1 Tax=Ciona intestinalis TaxID=7719 RepID=UPI000521A075|nr:uncharacterized protein LOC100178769 isoform X2 [Ciona intestinalis]|eukprot:XP_009861512.1 uncharacterized protein LOC100178769 isoform X2 [Ciona intestinalis]
MGRNKKSKWMEREKRHFKRIRVTKDNPECKTDRVQAPIKDKENVIQTTKCGTRFSMEANHSKLWTDNLRLADRIKTKKTIENCLSSTCNPINLVYNDVTSHQDKTNVKRKLKTSNDNVSLKQWLTTKDVVRERDTSLHHLPDKENIIPYKNSEDESVDESQQNCVDSHFFATLQDRFSLALSSFTSVLQVDKSSLRFFENIRSSLNKVASDAQLEENKHDISDARIDRILPETRSKRFHLVSPNEVGFEKCIPPKKKLMLEDLIKTIQPDVSDKPSCTNMSNVQIYNLQHSSYKANGSWNNEIGNLPLDIIFSEDSETEMKQFSNNLCEESNDFDSPLSNVSFLQHSMDETCINSPSPAFKYEAILSHD